MTTHEFMYGRLLPRREDILNYLEDYYAEHGWMPSVREIAADLGLAAPSSVQYHLKALEKLGYVTRLSGRSRCIALTNPPDRKQVRVPRNAS